MGCIFLFKSLFRRKKKQEPQEEKRLSFESAGSLRRQFEAGASFDLGFGAPLFKPEELEIGEETREMLRSVIEESSDTLEIGSFLSVQHSLQSQSLSQDENLLKPPTGLQRKLSRKDSKKLKRSGSRREPLIQLDENGNPIHFPKEAKLERSASRTGTLLETASKKTGSKLDRSNSRVTANSAMLECIPSKSQSGTIDRHQSLSEKKPSTMDRKQSSRSKSGSVRRTKSTKKFIDAEYSSGEAMNVSRTRSKKKNDDNIPLALSIAKSSNDENVPLAILQRTGSNLEPKRSKARRSTTRKSRRESSSDSVDIPFNY